jgi:hypothetical protein
MWVSRGQVVVDGDLFEGISQESSTARSSNTLRGLHQHEISKTKSDK